MKTVFISYSRIDNEWATELAEALRASGLEPWLDTDDIPRGESLMRQIESAISACDAVVPIFRDRASPAVLIEVGIALALGKKIIPVITGKAVRIPPITEMANVQTVHETRAAAAATQIASAVKKIR
jgi:hypothetical protein